MISTKIINFILILSTFSALISCKKDDDSGVTPNVTETDDDDTNGDTDDDNNGNGNSGNDDDAFKNDTSTIQFILSDTSEAVVYYGFNRDASGQGLTDNFLSSNNRGSASFSSYAPDRFGNEASAYEMIPWEVDTLGAGSFSTTQPQVNFGIIPIKAKAFTVSIWLKIANPNNGSKEQQSILSIRNSLCTNSENNYLEVFYQNTDLINRRLVFSPYSSQAFTSGHIGGADVSVDDFPNDTWTLVTFTLEPSVSKLYVNGELKKTRNFWVATQGNNFVLDPHAELGLGTSPCINLLSNDRMKTIEGEIDDLVIFNKALSQEEINLLK